MESEFVIGIINCEEGDFMKLFKWFEKRSTTSGNYDVFTTSSLISNYAGELVNSDTALQVPPYAGAVNLLSTSLAKLSKHVFANGERVEGHKVEKLLRNPNELMDGYTLFQQAEFNRLQEGDCFIYIQRNDQGEAEKLFLINPAFVTIKLDGDSYHYMVTTNGSTKLVRPKDMIHVRTGVIDCNNLKGRGMPTILKEQLGLWLAAQKHQATYFALGGNPTSILTTDEKLSEEKRKLVREAWERLNGNANRHRVAVIDGGFRYQSLAHNWQELEMNALYDQLTKQIASAFNLPGFMIGHDGSKNTYSNVESQSIQFLQQALMPSITAWEYQLQKIFGYSSKFYIRLNYETLLRADSMTRANRIKTLIDAGVITQEEGRVYEGLPKDGAPKPKAAPQPAQVTQPPAVGEQEEVDHGTDQEAMQ